jgi:hypothetical protein
MPVDDCMLTREVAPPSGMNAVILLRPDVELSLSCTTNPQHVQRPRRPDRCWAAFRRRRRSQLCPLRLLTRLVGPDRGQAQGAGQGPPRPGLHRRGLPLRHFQLLLDEGLPSHRRALRLPALEMRHLPRQELVPSALPRDERGRLSRRIRGLRRGRIQLQSGGFAPDAGEGRDADLHRHAGRDADQRAVCGLWRAFLLGIKCR